MSVVLELFKIDPFDDANFDKKCNFINDKEYHEPQFTP